ncbi:hypothetical protein M0813_13511 [Anaeramoeba flamelloides]|uniref:Transmembrane protein n=1 Tax=Anaeramoeba flamelloides TaxID=1746091 RepID=A0ABQ8Z893_9EUKA|nr:hypothetical protein M0813_13511 [Anaeramoeba flamelloides]
MTIVYTLSSISISCVLVYCLVMVLNLQICNCLCCKQPFPVPFVRIGYQICICIIGSVVLGVVNGVLFGTFDVEDSHESYHDFHLYQLYVLPTGFLCGFVVGYFNQYLRDFVFREKITIESTQHHPLREESSLLSDENEKDVDWMYGVGNEEKV